MAEVRLAVPEGTDFKVIVANKMADGSLVGVAKFENELPIPANNPRGAEGGVLEVVKFIVDNAENIAVLVALAKSVLVDTGASKILVRFFGGAGEDLGNIERSADHAIMPEDIPMGSAKILIQKAE